MSLPVVANSRGRADGRRTAGASYAVLSGALASGVGYAPVWCAALRGLAATQAATVQLSVPVLYERGRFKPCSTQMPFFQNFPAPILQRASPGWAPAILQTPFAHHDSGCH